MHQHEYFQQVVEGEIKKISLRRVPEELYEPIRYMLSLAGKRLRPSLVLMGTELFGGDYREALPPAVGIEIFHNFTLLHDDIMDKAPLRRSKETVHKKWNTAIAIISGDAMFVKSCELMMQVKDDVLRDVLSLFYKTAIEVCEGQQFDMNYETMQSVSIHEYIDMISLKTAALLACSLKTGALIAEASEKDASHIYDFGKNIGIAFQLHDDILDVYGDEQKFGKQSGGDILANKKTFLLLQAIECAHGKNLEELKYWIAAHDFNPVEKITAVKEIFSSLRIREAAEDAMEAYFQKAVSSFDQIDVPEERKSVLRTFAEKLMVREA
jgi:geranylgeranyl diphosphate synthase type II